MDLLSRGCSQFCDASWGHLHDRTEGEFCMFAEIFLDVPILNSKKKKKWASEDFFRQTHVVNDHIGIFCVMNKLEVLRLHISKCTRPQVK